MRLNPARSFTVSREIFHGLPRLLVPATCRGVACQCEAGSLDEVPGLSAKVGQLQPFVRRPFMEIRKFEIVIILAVQNIGEPFERKLRQLSN